MSGYSVFRFKAIEAGDSVQVVRHALGESRDPATEALNAGDESAAERGTVTLALASDAEREADMETRQEWLSTRTGPRPKPLAEFVFAGPPSYGDDDEWPESKERKWADAELAWVRKRFPHSLVVAASLHRDETSPHVHIVISPQTRDDDGNPQWGWCLARNNVGNAIIAERKGVNPKASNRRNTKASAKRCLSLLQDDVHAFVGEPFGLERGKRGSDAKHEVVDKAKAVSKKADLLKVYELELNEREERNEEHLKVSNQRLAADTKKLRAKERQHGTLTERQAVVDKATAANLETAKKLEEVRKSQHKRAIKLDAYEASLNARQERLIGMEGRLEKLSERLSEQSSATTRKDNRVSLANHILGCILRTTDLTSLESRTDVEEWALDLQTVVDGSGDDVSAIAIKHGWKPPETEAAKRRRKRKQKAQDAKIVPFPGKGGRGE